MPSGIDTGSLAGAVARGRCARTTWIHSTLLATVLAGALCLFLAGAGCVTRSGAPVYGEDSTLVYPSRLANDVNASITFQLKDSATRDAARKRDRDRSREISHLKHDRAAVMSEIKDETARRQKAEMKKQAREEKKARKARGKKARKGSGGDASPAPIEIPRPDPALRDSLSAIEARLAALMVEDSIASLATWKIKRTDGRPPDERVVDLEDGARVQATVRLQNVYARGKRPLLFHFVWLNPAKKRVFKKMLEYMPNDSTQTLTSSFTISPAKRANGAYTIQVFLFREEIAEKEITLRGSGVEEKEGGGGGGM